MILSNCTRSLRPSVTSHVSTDSEGGGNASYCSLEAAGSDRDAGNAFTALDCSSRRGSLTSLVNEHLEREQGVRGG